jgi:putative flippase GtrA
MKSIALKLFFIQTDNTLIQFFRYLFVGGFSTVIDIGSLFIMTSLMHVNYLISAALAFILGIIANYILSTAWIFKSKGNKSKEIFLFLVIGVTGLLWNELIIWSLVAKIGLFYISAKLVSTVLVLVWNFGMRKKFVF